MLKCTIPPLPLPSYNLPSAFIYDTSPASSIDISFSIQQYLMKSYPTIQNLTIRNTQALTLGPTVSLRLAHQSRIKHRIVARDLGPVGGSVRGDEDHGGAQTAHVGNWLRKFWINEALLERVADEEVL